MLRKAIEDGRGSEKQRRQGQQVLDEAPAEALVERTPEAVAEARAKVLEILAAMTQ